MDARLSQPTTTPLSALLRAGTRELHTRAERSGIMRGLLRGEVDRASYCGLLRNLHAIYAALETALAACASDPSIAPIHDPALSRRVPLEQDLELLHGTTWRDIAITRAADDYAAHVAAADPPRLVAHAYVRYLGDLSGGQMLARIVRESLKLHGTAGTQFYRFADDANRLAQTLRHGIDTVPCDDDGRDVIVDEARWAFSMHVGLFEELAADGAS